MTDCLFCKILAREIPAFIVYEDEDTMAFLDIKPVNPGHTLVVPKTHSEGLHDADPETLSHLVHATQKVARAILDTMGVSAFNLEENNGPAAGQIIPHLHFHIIPRQPGDGLRHWPGTPYPEGQIAEVAEKIKTALI